MTIPQQYPTPHFRSRIQRLALMLTCVGAITACGGGGDDGPGNAAPPPPPSTGAPSPAPAPAPATPTSRDVHPFRVSAGLSYSLAVNSNGDVLYWGTGMSGATAKTGIGGTAVSVLSGVRDVAALATGNGHVAISSSGQAIAWGYAPNGAFGDWWNNVADAPVSLPQYGSSRQVASAGCSGQASVWLSLHDDGSVWSVPGIADPGIGQQPSTITASRIGGLPDVGRLGNGECATAISNDGELFTLTALMSVRNTPTFAYVFDVVANPVAGLPPVVDSSCLQSLCFVAARDGTVWGWGENSGGQLGDGTTTARLVPTRVPGLSGISRVFTTQGGITFAIGGDGQVYSWGGSGSDHHLLGRGWNPDDPEFRSTPRLVAGLPLPVVSFSASNHAIAQLSDGSIWTWGYGGNGQLGDGTTNSSDQPVRVPVIQSNPAPHLP